MYYDVDRKEISGVAVRKADDPNTEALNDDDVSCQKKILGIKASQYIFHLIFIRSHQLLKHY